MTDQLCLDPGGLVTISCVAQHSQAQDSEGKNEHKQVNMEHILLCHLAHQVTHLTSSTAYHYSLTCLGGQLGFCTNLR